MRSPKNNETNCVVFSSFSRSCSICIMDPWFCGGGGLIQSFYIYCLHGTHFCMLVFSAIPVHAFSQRLGFPTMRGGGGGGLRLAFFRMLGASF